MELEITLTGYDANLSTLQSLQQWVKGEDIPGLHVLRASKPPSGEQMGADLMEVITVALSAPEIYTAAVVALVETLHVWISSRRRDLRVTVRAGEKLIEIDAKNVKSEEELLQQAKSLVEKL